MKELLINMLTNGLLLPLEIHLSPRFMHRPYLSRAWMR